MTCDARLPTAAACGLMTSGAYLPTGRRVPGVMTAAVRLTAAQRDGFYQPWSTDRRTRRVSGPARPCERVTNPRGGAARERQARASTPTA